MRAFRACERLKVDITVSVVGSPRYEAEQAPLSQDVQEHVTRLEQQGKTVVLVLSDGRAVASLALHDEPRADVAHAIAELQRLGVRPVMLTGDNHRAAEAISTALSVEVRANCCQTTSCERWPH